MSERHEYIGIYNKPVKFHIKNLHICSENSEKTLGGYFILPHPVVWNVSALVCSSNAAVDYCFINLRLVTMLPLVQFGAF